MRTPYRVAKLRAKRVVEERSQSKEVDSTLRELRISMLHLELIVKHESQRTRDSVNEIPSPSSSSSWDYDYCSSDNIESDIYDIEKKISKIDKKISKILDKMGIPKDY